jgi:hypothetical protein
VEHYAVIQRTSSADATHASFHPAPGDHERPGMTQRIDGRTHTHCWRVSQQVSDLIRQGEQEHLDDARAYQLTYNVVEDAIEATYAFSLAWGVVIPTVRAEWEHEYSARRRIPTGRLLDDPSVVVPARTDEPDRDYFNLGAGVSAQFRSRTAAFASYEAVVGRTNFVDHRFTVGIRQEF